MKEVEKNIPESVIKEATGLINLYGNTLKYLGEHKGFDVYKFVFPKDTETGFPFVYLHDTSNDRVMEITGFDALHIVCGFIKE